MGRDSESGRRHLLDITVLGISIRKRNEPLRIFTAFAGVALAAESVHRDRQRFVRFLADRPKRHGAGVETLDDFLGRLHFFDGNRLGNELELQQTTQIRPPIALVVHELREFGVGLRIVRAAGVLQFVDRLRIPVVMLTLDAVVDLAAEIQLTDRAPAHRPVRCRRSVSSPISRMPTPSTRDGVPVK